MTFSDPDLRPRENLCGGESTLAGEIDLQNFIPSAAVVELLDEALARRIGVVPLAFDDQKKMLSLVAVSMPELPQRDVLNRSLPRDYRVQWFVGEKSAIELALEACYQHCHDLRALCKQFNLQLRQHTQVESKLVELVNAVLIHAIESRASDIHIARDAQHLRIRFRIDGVLRNMDCLHRSHHGAISVRLKVLAEMDIAEQRRPQDGQFSVLVNGRRIDIRVSTFPLINGESLVLRILDKQAERSSLQSLGLPIHLCQQLQHQIEQPQGLIVVSGPTGSGKSTTLYSLLAERNSDALNIVSLEDPVEYPTDGVLQANIDPDRGLDYADGVRALLRHDPDVLLIGEIRDSASCAMALRAAMTGHQVLTTVHANDAVSVIARLMELGASAAMIASCLRLVLAQRLVRTCCNACRNLDSLQRHVHCDSCQGSGFHGRRAIIEILPVAGAIACQLRQSPDAEALRLVAGEQGFVSLRDRGAELLQQQLTTAQELDRVLGHQE